MIEELARRVRAHPKVVALTGAGVSAPSGIPTYRDADGAWRHSEPIQHQQFVTDESSRRRYWARSMRGWRHVGRARPNPAHRALAELERLGHVQLLVTQNVDRLHQQAGHREVVDLHGRLDRVVCLECAAVCERAALQAELEALNPDFEAQAHRVRPDGDADIEDTMLNGFRVPACHACGGVLMPDVVFFGGSVPRERVERVNRAIEAADALLVAGSSLMVYSGFRFARLARELGKQLIIINRGRTRADGLASLEVDADCCEALPGLAAALAP